jgi:hypothetical protein
MLCSCWNRCHLWCDPLSPGVQVSIGRQARMTPKESLEALDAAVNSWNNGNGVWAKATMKVSWPLSFSAWPSARVKTNDQRALDTTKQCPPLSLTCESAVQERIVAMQKFVTVLKTKRDIIVNVLM